jgi:biotin operon repressor
LVVGAVLILPTAVSGQGSGGTNGLDATKIEQALGRPVQKIGDVYKVGFPRTDLHVSIQGLAIKPGLALGSWAAFTGSDEHAMVMGDLVLLEDEVNPVMEKLRASGFEISAVHNHLLYETPRVMYMHYMGHGSASELAASLRGALAVSKTPLEKPAAAAVEEAAPPSWVKAVEDTLGRKGTLKGGVLSFAVPRADSITLGGTIITPAAGVAEAINFQAADAGVATTGDFVLTAGEVNAVISALEAHGIRITALHSHMLTEEPRLFFMHFWAVGPEQSVAEGIKAALNKVHIK